MEDQCINDDNFIRETRNAESVYNHWQSFIDKIAAMTKIERNEHIYKTLDIGFILFPLIESMGNTIYGVSEDGAVMFLKKLGHKEHHSRFIVQMFRNGYLHNLRPIKLIYDNGVINYSVSSGGSSSGELTHYFDGYENIDYPEDNIPADKVFDYKNNGTEDGEMIVYLDKLAAQVKFHIDKMRAENKIKTFKVVYAKKMIGNKPRD